MRASDVRAAGLRRVKWLQPVPQSPPRAFGPRCRWAAESEPTSVKDRLLMQAAPHLVLDGAEQAAVAVGASTVTVCVHREAHAVADVQAAIRERRPRAGPGIRINVVTTPRWYVSAEATAIARYVGGEPAKPRADEPGAHLPIPPPASEPWR